MRVTVFCSLVSPWSYVGVVRLERAVATFTLRTGRSVDVVLRALDADGDPAPTATVDGITFDHPVAADVDPVDAHRLLLWAGATAGRAAQRDLAHELWRAYFIEGADVGDHDTLAARAAVVGLDADAAEAWLHSDGGLEEVALQVETARAVGLTEVPTAVIEGAYVVSGIQTQKGYLEVLEHVARERDQR